MTAPTSPDHPPQVTLGGHIGALVWKRYVRPLLTGPLSCREVGALLGVAAMTVSRWRRQYR